MNNRDCIHGRQIGKCPECDAIALEPELDQLRTQVIELQSDKGLLTIALDGKTELLKSADNLIAELQEENTRLKEEVRQRKENATQSRIILTAMQLYAARLREALENIKWHREPGGSPNKYQYEVEVIAECALNSTPPDLSEVEAMRKDAERYRWLRDNNTGRALSISALSWNGDPNDADSAIDAAMLAAWDSHEHD